MSEGQRTSYDPTAIEEKWQESWEAEGTNSLSEERLRTAERPFYNLMMFPYPSAEGLHVGNIYAFTGADIYGRYRRLQGDDVFEPIGFDAFGIHSENFALRIGTHPMELIPSNVANFTRQLRRTGAMFDWNRTVDTTAPEYYRWTQWLFLQLYKAGLAEKKEAPVNWCPGCHTVLANEQVIAGACERCSSVVEQRFLSQWFFKITKYAPRLLENLSWIDWSETTRKAQENWIGKSEGVEISFPLARPRVAPDRHAPAQLHAEKPVIRVFTTRPDTLYGATFMVLAPEHPLVDGLTTAEQRPLVEAYRARIATMDVVTRKKTDLEKTGVFTGGHCINPATGKEIPVWIADYVLMEYGTGAVMAVPGHDQRDFDFATKFALPILRVVAGEPDHEGTPLHEAYIGDGVVVNSDQFNGLGWEEAKSAITKWLEERGLATSRVNYRLHDWCISRQRYWGPPIPIIYCDQCGTVPVPEADLPVVLPYVENYKPDTTGVSPLARVEEWYRVPCPECGGEARRETDVSDTFLDSAWYFLRYPSAGDEAQAFDREITKRWLPVDMYIGGEEHAVLHLLYSRFITMALHDLGWIDFEEPFKTFRKHGLIVKDGAKMSKSRGNVVIPDEFIARFGADAFRTYLMFLGPYQEGGDFRDQGLQGPYGFLSRLWDTVVPVEDLGNAAPAGELERKLHATIQKVTEDLAELRYNTAIAAMMEYLNVVREGGRAANRAEIEPLVVLIAPFAPHLAEELWELLGNGDSIFQATSTHAEDGRQPATATWPTVPGGRWPVYDPAKTAADVVDLVVQINGKVRARIPVQRGTAEDAAREAAIADERVRRFIDDTPIRKTIFVPDRLINFVIG